MTIPIGLGRKHANSKLEFSDTDTSKSKTISANKLDPKAEGKKLAPNPDSTYMLYFHNPSSQTVTLKIYNKWTDADDTVRWIDITNGGMSITAGTTDYALIEALFMGSAIKIEASVGAGEGSAWDFYYTIRRP